MYFLLSLILNGVKPGDVAVGDDEDTADGVKIVVVLK